MVNQALGIDTGGTFTDGVIFDLDQKVILKKTKKITTRHDLNLAIENCLNGLINEGKEVDLDDIEMVSLSTTLATNAIVEGQGAEVGLILIGFEPCNDLPTPYYFNIAGGCNIKGKIKDKVDLKAARKGIEQLESKVDAFAISGYLSVRNPAQEIEVENLVRNLTGYPVVSAHQLSSELGFHERTVTAIFNARLMPLITDLIGAVKKNLASRRIKAPLMVVKGDGSLISEEKVREKPVETLLSGPAASIVGSISLTGIKDGIVVDMGGTTTDLAILKEGRPHLTKKGARVGGWLTRVKAADITTVGVGGDSFIQVAKDSSLSIGPQRVFPLSWLISENPNLYCELKEIKKVNFAPIGAQPTSFLVFIKEPVNFEPTDTEKEILDLIREEPHSLYHVAGELGKEADILPWDHLVNVGSIHRSSLTPTDILHVQDDFARWDEEAARLGTEIMARRYNSELKAFIKAVLEKIYFKISALIVGVLVNKKGYKLSLDDKSVKFFLKEMLGNSVGEDEVIEFFLKSNLPLIAVGAPVGAYFPQIGKRLNAKLFLPEFAEVANAIGTVSGKVVERAVVIIKPGEKGGFLVHTPEKRKGFIDFKAALDYGHQKGREYVYRQAQSSGASGIEIVIDQHDKYSNFPGQNSDRIEDKLFIESRLEISGVGRPW
jgi:N-methylhydantoinase A/oxoprolinase/acetone carboxylase beta subunit